MPNKTKRKQQKPLKSYVDLMVQGAKAHNLSAGHVAQLEAIVKPSLLESGELK